MSRKEIIFPGHGSAFNREAGKIERRKKHLEKKESKRENHKQNGYGEWPLADINKKYLIPCFKKNGEPLILNAQDLPEAVVPINVIEIEVKKELAS